MKKIFLFFILFVTSLYGVFSSSPYYYNMYKQNVQDNGHALRTKRNQYDYIVGQNAMTNQTYISLDLPQITFINFHDDEDEYGGENYYSSYASDDDEEDLEQATRSNSLVM